MTKTDKEKYPDRHRMGEAVAKGVDHIHERYGVQGVPDDGEFVWDNTDTEAAEELGRYNMGDTVPFDKRHLLDQERQFPDSKSVNWDDTPPRAFLLREAEAAITGDRNNQYGPPDQDFTRASSAMNVYGYVRVDAEDNVHDIEPADVAKIMILLKLSRAAHSSKKDNWLDIAGYAACGYEVDGCEE